MCARALLAQSPPPPLPQWLPRQHNVKSLCELACAQEECSAGLSQKNTCFWPAQRGMFSQPFPDKHLFETNTCFWPAQGRDVQPTLPDKPVLACPGRNVQPTFPRPTPVFGPPGRNVQPTLPDKPVSALKLSRTPGKKVCSHFLGNSNRLSSQYKYTSEYM